MYLGYKSWKSQHDSFIDTCKNNVLAAELYVKYDGKLEHIRDLSYTIDIEYREDPETLSLLRNGILPLPFGRLDRLERVWYFKAYFRSDRNLETELLIGQCKGLFGLVPLGCHNGKEWFYEPVSYRCQAKR